jgi:hypothetical protein
MTHPWREHIRITRENNPNVNNFGEIIKLAKKTYKKSNGNNAKKTLKKGGGKSDNDKIYADKIDNKGEKRRYHALKEGPCIFPFKYNNKTYNECAESKDGKWCATELKDDGTNKHEKWGYCETHLKKEEIEKIQDDDTSETGSDKEEEQEFEVHPIEYGDDKYLLDKTTRNIYSYPDEEENYIFVGKALPNGEIDFEATEYIPKKKKIKEEKISSKAKSSHRTSISSTSSTGGGKYGIYNEDITILEKFGEIYRIKNNKGEIFLTDKKNIF